MSPKVYMYTLDGHTYETRVEGGERSLVTAATRGTVHRVAALQFEHASFPNLHPLLEPLYLRSAPNSSDGFIRVIPRRHTQRGRPRSMGCTMLFSHYLLVQDKGTEYGIFNAVGHNRICLLYICTIWSPIVAARAQFRS